MTTAPKTAPKTALSAGDTAPAFDLPRDGGDTVSLSAYRGQSVVLYFYPRDDTSGCTTEALDFTALAHEFAAQATVVMGISKDTVAKHDKFRDKHGLGVILLSDAEAETCEAYGTWVEKKMYGKTFMGIERTTFLIGPDGVIQHIWPKVRAKGHADAVLEHIQALD